MRKVALLASIVTVFAAGLLAQNRMSSSGVGHAPAGVTRRGFAPSGNRNSIGISGIPFGEFHRRGFRRAGSLYWPYFYSDYYPDSYDYDSQPPAPAPPPAPAASQARQEPVPDPVLLELQGNQWVKVSSFAMPSVQTSSGLQADVRFPKEMPPTVLVYRDGHSEELTSYSIIGTSIYTKSDYWSNGAWTRTIQIADLDIPATLKQNQQRGVKFELPSGPNEVMIRP